MVKTNKQPWRRRSGETAPAFKAFQAYRDAGPGREKLAVFRIMYGCPGAKTPHGYFTDWAKKNKWNARARAYDARQDAIEQDAKDKVVAEAAAKREENRQDKIGELGWEVGLLLIDKGKKMAAAPVFEIVRDTITETDKDGRPVTVNRQVVKPIKWKANDITSMFKIGIEICRLSEGMTTGSSRLEVVAVDVERVAAELGVTTEELLAEAGLDKPGING